jgi:type IV secretory pathway VirB4 component
LSKEELNHLSAQELVPIKALDSGVFVTPDNRMVQILKVSAINLELMSNAEVNEILEEYEAFLKSLMFEVQIEMVSQPVDLKRYIETQQEILKGVHNPYRRKLLEGYIEYARNIEISQNIIQRQRYIIFDESIKMTGRKGYEDAILELQGKMETVVSGLKDLDLIVEEVTDLEIMKYFQIFFNYSGAQYTPILSDQVPQITLGGKLNA